MKDRNVIVDGLVRQIVGELAPDDPRVGQRRGTGDDRGAADLAVAVLADRSLSDEIVGRAMFLSMCVPTEEGAAAVVDAMKRRPGLAVAAREVLRRAKTPGIVPTLGTILDDQRQPAEARAAAAAVIGGSGYPGAKDILVRALKVTNQDPEVLCESAHGLGYIQLLEGKTDTADLLCDLLSADVPDVRLAAINGLSKMWARHSANRIEALISDRGVSKSGERVGERAAVVVDLLRLGSTK